MTSREEEEEEAGVALAGAKRLRLARAPATAQGQGQAPVPLLPPPLPSKRTIASPAAAAAAAVASTRKLVERVLGFLAGGSRGARGDVGRAASVCRLWRDVAYGEEVWGRMAAEVLPMLEGRRDGRRHVAEQGRYLLERRVWRADQWWEGLRLHLEVWDAHDDLRILSAEGRIEMELDESNLIKLKLTGTATTPSTTVLATCSITAEGRAHGPAGSCGSQARSSSSGEGMRRTSTSPPSRPWTSRRSTLLSSCRPPGGSPPPWLRGWASPCGPRRGRRGSRRETGSTVPWGAMRSATRTTMPVATWEFMMGP
jgi:hypothetical protein